MTMPSEPIVTTAYDAVTADGAASWPDTELPGAIVVPEKPPTTWNYSEPVQESVGEYNGDRGPSYIALMEGEVVEVVLQNVLALNGVAEMHSWHLHGHSFYVVGSGFGSFDEETDPASYNLENPVRRDTVTVLPYGWTAIRFKANNPGAWLFHCTQPAHVIMGMAVLIGKKSIRRNRWSSTLVESSGYREEDVVPVARRMFEAMSMDLSSSTELNALKHKYGRRSKSNVAHW
ncbi:hypothetical protein ACHAWU_001877 [Discostella pseudostelligera]|uniref:Plastocyanin-like domain-containing protein n=1 Tax=Discostella pseudostelligera TaxID=259834 RepID=A0ABD3MJW1_9STRA